MKRSLLILGLPLFITVATPSFVKAQTTATPSPSSSASPSPNVSPSSPSAAPNAPSTCDVKDIGVLKAELSKRYNSYIESQNQLFQQLRDQNIEIETINTQSQIDIIHSIYSCVSPNQDDKTLGTKDQRKVIREPLNEIAKVLNPAKQLGFTPGARQEVKKAYGKDCKILDDFNQDLENCLNLNSEKLKSAIDSLATPSPPPSPPITPLHQPISSGLLQSPLAIWIAFALELTGLIWVIFNLIKFQKDLGQLVKQQKEVQEQNNDRLKQLEDRIGNQQKSFQNTPKVSSLDIEGLKEEVKDLKNKLSELQIVQQRNAIPPHSIAIQSGSHNDPPPSQPEGIGVSETKDSFNQRWSGLPTPVVLERAANYNFVIANQQLWPKPGLIVTETKRNTIDGLFECENFQSGANFEVIKPATVQSIDSNKWQVTQKGKLNFY